MHLSIFLICFLSILFQKLEFTLSDDVPQPNSEKISIAKIKEELNSLLLKPKTKNEEIFDWIDVKKKYKKIFFN